MNKAGKLRLRKIKITVNRRFDVSNWSFSRLRSFTLMSKLLWESWRFWICNMRIPQCLMLCKYFSFKHQWITSHGSSLTVHWVMVLVLLWVTFRRPNSPVFSRTFLGRWNFLQYLVVGLRVVVSCACQLKILSWCVRWWVERGVDVHRHLVVRIAGEISSLCVFFISWSYSRLRIVATSLRAHIYRKVGSFSEISWLISFSRAFIFLGSESLFRNSSARMSSWKRIDGFFHLFHLVLSTLAKVGVKPKFWHRRTRNSIELSHFTTFKVAEHSFQVPMPNSP